MRRNLLVSFASAFTLLTVAVSGGSCAVAAETITMVTTGKGSAQEWPIFIAEAKGFMAELHRDVLAVIDEEAAHLLKRRDYYLEVEQAQARLTSEGRWHD